METVSAAHLTASALAMQPESGQNCAAKRTAAHRSETQTRMCSHPVISLFSDYVETYVTDLCCSCSSKAGQKTILLIGHI